MALPKLSHPTFELEIPSTKQKIRYRPFLVKEEKILLIAQSSEDPKEIIYAVKQVLQNCSLDQIDIDDLTTFDIEYFFIKLRSKSVNNIVNLRYKDLEDEKIYEFEVDLDGIEIEYNKDHQKTINVSQNTILNLKYPKMNMINSLEKIKNETDLVFEILRNCLDTIVHDSQVIEVSNYSREEIDEFILSMDVSSFNKVQEFFNTMPKLKHEIVYTNSLGNQRKIILQSLNDFFQLG
jgi:hypothetical protein